MERLTLLLTQSKIFDWFRKDGNFHKELQQAVYRVVMESLLQGLESYQKEILLHSHWYQSDPNDPRKRRMTSILQRLIDDACFFGMNHNCIKTDLYIYSLKDMTGFDEDEDLFEEQIQAINDVWGEYASISYSYEKKYLTFEIHLKN